MENKLSKSKASVPVVSGGNKIVEKKLNNQVIEVATQPTKKGGAKKVAPVSATTAPVTVPAPATVSATTAPVPAPATVSATVQKGKGKGKGKKVESTTTTTPSKKVSTKKNVVSTELEAEPEAQSKLRYFKLFYNNEICGRYCGKKPKQAANKAFSSIVKDMNKDGVSVTVDSQLEVPFTIKECTRNSKHKEYKYVGKRHLLKEPVKVSIENSDGSVKEIIYKFHNQLQKAPKE
jgi:hypothetical protein